VDNFMVTECNGPDVCFHSFHKYLLSCCYVLSMAISAKDRMRMVSTLTGLELQGFCILSLQEVVTADCVFNTCF
jgi:hypothetical protein